MEMKEETNRRDQELWDVLPHLLTGAERLRGKVLDELHCHLIRVIGTAVYALLLQEVDFYSYGGDVLGGCVKGVNAGCERETNKQKNKQT